MSSTAGSNGAATPAIPTPSVSATNVLAAACAASGTSPAAIRVRCVTILWRQDHPPNRSPKPSSRRQPGPTYPPAQKLKGGSRLSPGRRFLKSGQCCERTDIREPVEAEDRRAQFAGTRGAEHRLRERTEFGDEPLALTGDVAAWDPRIVARP